MNPTAGDRPLETLTQWMNAPLEERRRNLEGCLDRIRARDGALRAWAQVSPQTPTGSGPLSEIPFGVKDIIETEALSTAFGSPIYEGRIGTGDAAIVRDLRERGALLLGKTQTTPFAYFTPGPTCNPHNLEHTPGGSSSGSAAAVAAGMVPFALGTQTKGSVLRPASYCGVTGFKPTYGLLPTDGVLPFAHSLDTLGFFTHTAQDMVMLWTAIGYGIGRATGRELGAPFPAPEVEPDMADAFTRASSELQRAGFIIRPLAIGALLDRLNVASDTIMEYEGARVHEERFREHGERLDGLAEMVRRGLQISDAQYEAARRTVAECRLEVAALYEITPVVVVPAATGSAPYGLRSTGNPRMNAPWTALGTPAISIPLPKPPGLPLGLQLTAAWWNDCMLLSTAESIERALA